MKPLRDVERAQAMVEAGLITPQNSCLQKVAFALRTHALGAAKRMGQKVGRKTEVYKCPFCKHYHVTKLRHGEGE